MINTVNQTRTARGKVKKKRKPLSEKASLKLRWYKLTAIAFLVLFIFALVVNAVVAGGKSDETLPKSDTVSVETSNDLYTTSNITYRAENKLEFNDTVTTTTIAPTPKEVKSEETEKPAEETTGETTTPSEEEKNYTDDDLFYLAAAVCREAGGETDEIQLLVANVIINRVNSSIYPNTIYDVLTQKSQYGTMWKYGISFPDWANQSHKDHCYEIAERILDGERVCPENVLFQAEFEQGSGIYKQFGNDYYFCYY